MSIGDATDLIALTSMSKDACVLFKETQRLSGRNAAKVLRRHRPRSDLGALKRLAHIAGHAVRASMGNYFDGEFFDGEFIWNILRWGIYRGFVSWGLTGLALVDVTRYALIKNYMDVKLGVPSQCMLQKHFTGERGVNPQYLANVALKVNVKVGGRNHSIATQARLSFHFFFNLCQLRNGIFLGIWFYSALKTLYIFM